MISGMRTIAALSFAAICAAQTFSFEAASVKPSNPAAREQYGGGPGTENPRQITYIATLQRILTLAYGVRDYQVSGPSWITTDKFEIIAKVPAQASPQQVGPMLQSLLAERFALQVHRDSREFSGYELQVARSGLKMKESAGNLKIAGPQQDGKPAGVLVFADWLGHRAIARLNNGLMRYMGLGQSAADLATLCENQMHLPVVDRTGLKGVYDYDLDTARPTPAASAPTDGAIAEAADPGPDFATALERQLGLRLEKKKVSVDIIVVDQIARTPTEN